jgi:hypothetical protein
MKRQSNVIWGIWVMAILVMIGEPWGAGKNFPASPWSLRRLSLDGSSSPGWIKNRGTNRMTRRLIKWKRWR